MHVCMYIYIYIHTYIYIYIYIEREREIMLQGTAPPSHAPAPWPASRAPPIIIFNVTTATLL